MDLFGPMPSSNHIIVVQELSPRYLASKLAISTKTENVIQALKEIYNNYRRPKVQISDNGLPFSSSMMTKFANENDIELQKIPSLLPSSNPGETFMRPLGKAIKKAHMNKHPEKATFE